MRTVSNFQVMITLAFGNQNCRTGCRLLLSNVLSLLIIIIIMAAFKERNRNTERERERCEDL